ncbi:hypothetical protein [Nocardia sp. NPDC049149]|uniref:hypothetical protein n=1 Tax=Nocardia sp. NPDC049149 TaxID=3364315 RepID=UPI0037177C36
MTDDARLPDCLVEPGPLTAAAAILAMSRHLNCGGACLPRRRAEDAIGAEYVPSLPAEAPDDAYLAERLREATRLLAERAHNRPLK